MAEFFLASWTLWQREMARFFRQPSRVIGALGSPLVFWLVIGSGIGTSFRAGTGSAIANYSQYFFPGTLLLIIFFTAIFSTISLIEDRREGFLQSVLVAPIPAAALPLGKILGGTALAFLQAGFFLLLAPTIGIHLSAGSWLASALVLILNGFVLTSLGFVIAWQFESIQGFHAVMNLFLIPLWLLSGALFPAEGAAGWIRFLMRWNPLAYGLAALRAAIFPAETFTHGPSFAFSLLLTFLFALILFSAASFTASRRRVG